MLERTLFGAAVDPYGYPREWIESTRLSTVAAWVAVHMCAVYLVRA